MVVAALRPFPGRTFQLDCPNIPNLASSRVRTIRDMDLRQVVRINGWPEDAGRSRPRDGRALEG